MSETGEVPTAEITIAPEIKQPAPEGPMTKPPYQEFVGHIQKGRDFLKLLKNDLRRIQENREQNRQQTVEPENVFYRVIDKLTEHGLSKQSLIMYGLWMGEFVREYATGDSYLGEAGNPTGEMAPWAQKIPGIENLGNLAESYIAAYLAYYGLSIITSPIKEKVPEKLKVAAAFLASSAFFTATELGYMSARTTPVIADIPAGIIGPLIFSGVMLLNRKFIEDCGRAIKDLKGRIRADKKRTATVAPAVVPNTNQNPTK